MLLVCTWLQGWPLGIGYQFEASSLGKTVSTTLNIPYLTVVLCLEAGPHEASIGVVIVQVLIKQLYCCGIIGIASLPFLGGTLSNGPLGPQIPVAFLPLLQCSLNLRSRSCVVDISSEAGHPTSCYSLHFEQLLVFCNVIICHKEKLLWWELYLSVGGMQLAFVLS